MSDHSMSLRTRHVYCMSYWWMNQRRIKDCSLSAGCLQPGRFVFLQPPRTPLPIIWRMEQLPNTPSSVLLVHRSSAHTPTMPFPPLPSHHMGVMQDAEVNMRLAATCLSRADDDTVTPLRVTLPFLRSPPQS